MIEIPVMTDEDKIAVMQAHVDGKAVQYYAHGNPEWVDTHSPVWNWNVSTYRIKPVPEVVWINFYTDNEHCVHTTEERALRLMGPNCYKTAKFIEVIDD